MLLEYETPVSELVNLVSLSVTTVGFAGSEGVVLNLTLPNVVVVAVDTQPFNVPLESAYGIAFADGVKEPTGSDPPNWCLVAWADTSTPSIFPTFVISLPPILRFPDIDLEPDTKRYCVWSSASKPNKFPCTEDALTPPALNAIVGLISSTCVIPVTPC